VHDLEVRAVDTKGSRGSSQVVEVWVQNSSLGCATLGGGGQALAVLALFLALRRSVRKPA
jgi:DNA repair exonuclease SbcCD ATPase subunit